MSLVSAKIEDICLVGDGAHASIKRVPEGVPYLTSKNFKIDGLDLSKLDYISKKDYNKHFNGKSKAITKPILNDIMLSIIGSIGSPHLVKNSDEFGLSSSVSILRPNVDKILPTFLYYWLKVDFFQKSIQQIKSGVAQSFLSLGMIRSLPVNYFESLQTQKRIADILSDYDDLIENNLKRIKLLEQAAQNIYKEWFVHLRFPGYENTPINDETGLPEGWKEKKLSDYMNFKEGPGLRNWQFRTEGIPFLNIRMMNSSDLNFNSVKYLENGEVEQKYAHFLLEEFDHIISTSGTLGKVVTIRKSHLPLCLNTSIIRLRPKQISIGKWYIKRKVSSTAFLDEMKSFATGSAQLNFGPKHLNMMNIIVPKEKLGIEYERITNPMELKILSLLDYNQKLKAARDILLPRLMNRTIEA